MPGDLAGLRFGKPEEKMGLHAVPTTSAFYDHAHVEADRLIGAEGQGLQIAFCALDSGRLGIAAVAVGLAQAALDEATRLRERANDVRPQDHRPSGAGLRAGRHGRRGRQRTGHVSGRRPQTRSGPAVFGAGQRRQAGGHRRRDEGHHRRRAGVRRRRLHARLPRRALHARGQDHPDLRGHQPDSAAGHRPRACHVNSAQGRLPAATSPSPGCRSRSAS